MKNRKLRTQSAAFLFKNKIKTLPKTQNKLYLSVLTKINNRMDNIEAISPKPDELVENKNSRHPKGLWVLFGTEMWERFNFYGMRALLTLFMVNSLLIKEADAAIIYGGFLALCYLTPLLGGFIADKYIGNRFAIIVGDH